MRSLTSSGPSRRGEGELSVASSQVPNLARSWDYPIVVLLYSSLPEPYSCAVSDECRMIASRWLPAGFRNMELNSKPPTSRVADVRFRTTVRTRTSRTGQYVQVRFALWSGRIQVVRSSVLAKGLAHEQVQNLFEQGRTTYIGDEKNVTMEV